MDYTLTLKLKLSLAGGSADDHSAFLARVIAERLTRATGMRYPNEAETIAYMLEKIIEDAIGDHHTVAAVLLGSTEVDVEKRT